MQSLISAGNHVLNDIKTYSHFISIQSWTKSIKNLAFSYPQDAYPSDLIIKYYDPYPTLLNFVQSEAERIQPYLPVNFVYSEGKAGEISRS